MQDCLAIENPLQNFCIFIQIFEIFIEEIYLFYQKFNGKIEKKVERKELLKIYLFLLSKSNFDYFYYNIKILENFINDFQLDGILCSFFEIFQEISLLIEKKMK